MNEPEQQNSANMVGRTIAGRYTIRAVIGAGGMGFVYRAVQAHTEREVALKVLRGDLAHQEGIAERFNREARAASRINHPNAITIYEFGPDNGLYYLAMELLSGETLRQRLRREPPMDVEHALDVFESMAGALSAAHRVGVVHRDLKPDNIFLAQLDGHGEVVKVLDFGLAKLLDRAPGDEGLVTDVNLRLGTPRYMAPEQALGLQPIDSRCDLYALGLLLYEMLAQRAPFVGEDGMEVLAQRLRKEAPLLSVAAPDKGFTPELDQLVASLLVRDRDKRPGDAAEIIQRLRELRRTGRVFVEPEPPQTLIMAEETAMAPLPLRPRIITGVGQQAVRVSTPPSQGQPAFRPHSGQAPAVPKVTINPVAMPHQTGMNPLLSSQGSGYGHHAPALADDFDKPTVVLGHSLRGESGVLDRRQLDPGLRYSGAHATPSAQTPRSPAYPLGTPAGGSRILPADAMPGRRPGLFQSARARRLAVVLLTAAASAPLLALLYRECRPREAVPPPLVPELSSTLTPPPPRPTSTPLPVVTPPPPRPLLPSRAAERNPFSDKPRVCAVKLSSSPPGAQVLREGKLLGVTPLSDAPACGTTPIHYTLRLSGYLPHEISYAPEHRRSFSTTLKPEGGAPAPTKAPGLTKTNAPTKAPAPGAQKAQPRPAQPKVPIPF